MRKLAVFFPGIGYTADRPLLYYSRRTAVALGYETRSLSYTGFPADVLGSSEKMTECYRIALAQAAEILSDVRWDSFDDILFIGKSVGTSIAAWFAAKSPVRHRIRLVLFTPLEETFTFPTDRAIVFTGTSDPWVGGPDSRIPDICAKRRLPCVVIPGGNHSLETSEPDDDIRNLQTIMTAVRSFMKESELPEGMTADRSFD